MLGQVDGDKFLVEVPPLVAKLTCQVLLDSIVCANEIARKALCCKNATLAQHYAVVVLHASRILPVRSSCIIPCLSWSALASLASSVVISVSMSERTTAMAVCSSIGGGTTPSFFS